MESIIIVNGKARRPIISDMLKLLTPVNSGLIGEYTKRLNKAYAPRHVASVIREVLKYMLRTQNNGIDSVLESTNRDVSRHCGSIESVSDAVKGHRIGYLRIFLHFLITEHGLSPSLEMTASIFMYDRIVFIDELPERKQQAFETVLKTCKADTIDREHYWRCACELSALLEEQGYSFTVKRALARAWRCLYVFMCANDLEYTSELAARWVTETIAPGFVDWRSYRRAFALLDYYFVNENLKPDRVYCRNGRDLSDLPPWCTEPLSEYLSVKERDGLATTSVKMQRVCNLRFFDYLLANGMTGWSDLTPQIIMDFHVQDAHLTTAGKNAYTSRVRQFLGFLAQLGHVPDTYQLALPSSSVNETMIIKTLSEAELAQIEEFKNCVEAPIDLRSICIVLLGLRLGLRCIDIVNLKLNDISWQKQEVLVAQSKTATELVLPLPTDVANCLCRYIMYGRPKTPSRSVFVRHHAPFCQLKRSACGAALARVLGRDDTNMVGFHITRKTFASRMLVSDVPVDTIADALGHTTTFTVNKYLSVDEAGMRRCAIPLAAIPIHAEVKD